MSHTNGIETVSAATKLRRMIEDPNGFVVGPGVHDGLSARCALEAGWDILYMTGAGTAASLLGQPDIGLATATNMISHAEMIANLKPSVPLIADMDTGYGNPSNVYRSTTAYIRAGVAGFHIEDQVQQKRCGHLANKVLVPTAEFVNRVQAAAAARRDARSDIVIIARTDALQAHGYDEALARLRAAREAGADVAFLEGVTSKDMARQVVRDMAPMPVLLNMVEHGATPTIHSDEARDMGFRIIIWPFAGLGAAIWALRAAYASLKKTGGLDDTKPITPKEIFELNGLNEWMEIDAQAGGVGFKGGV